MFQKKKLLGDMLVERGLITDEQLIEALNAQHNLGLRIGEVLIKLNYVSEKDIVSTLSEQLGVPFVNLSDFQIDTEALRVVKPEFAVEHQLIPMALDGNHLMLAMADPTDTDALEKLKQQTGYELDVSICSKSDLTSALLKHYNVHLWEGPESTPAEYRQPEKSIPGEKTKQTAQAATSSSASRPSPPGSAPAVSRPPAQSKVPPSSGEEKSHLQARTTGPAPSQQPASSSSPPPELLELLSLTGDYPLELHLVPDQEGHLNIRRRTDSGMSAISRLSPESSITVSTFLKNLLSGIRETGSAISSFARVTFDLKNRHRVFNLARVQAITGDIFVLRESPSRSELLSFEALLITSENAGILRSLLNLPGVITIFGQSGSGKRTLSLSSLLALALERRSILTLERGILYRVPGLVQLEATDTTSALELLGSMPARLADMIFVHGFDEPSISHRLFDMALGGKTIIFSLEATSFSGVLLKFLNDGIAPAVLAAAFSGGARVALAHRICESCRTEDTPSDELLSKLGLSPGKYIFYRGAGCEACRKTGLAGHTGIHEMLASGETLKKILIEKPGLLAQENTMKAVGAKGLLRDALTKAIRKLIPLSEVIRVAFPYAL